MFGFFKRPGVAVDCIIEKSGKILLQKRSFVHRGKWALPGGKVEYGEMVEDTVKREVKEETNLDVSPIDILGSYSHPDRDPRMHVVSIVFVCDYVKGELKKNYESINLKWFNPKELKKGDMAFDHWKIINDYLKWKKEKGTYWTSK